MQDADDDAYTVLDVSEHVSASDGREYRTTWSNLEVTVEPAASFIGPAGINSMYLDLVNKDQLSQDLMKLTIAELKALLELNGLKTGGANKARRVKRLVKFYINTKRCVDQWSLSLLEEQLGLPCKKEGHYSPNVASLKFSLNCRYHPSSLPFWLPAPGPLRCSLVRERMSSSSKSDRLALTIRS